MSDNSKDFGSGLFLGVLIGAALGILFAPQKGSETRQILSEKVHEVKDKAGQVAEGIREKADEVRKEGEKLFKPTTTT